MSRAFNGTTDSITFAAGAAAPDQGPITIVGLIKAANTAGFTGWMSRGRKAGSPVWAALTSNNAGPKFFMENDFGNGVAGLTTDWAYYVATRGSGVPTWHVQNFTHGGAWSHTAGNFNPGDGSGPIDDIIAMLSFPGSAAVMAVLPVEWSSSEVEANCTAAAADLLAAIAGNGWMVRFNQTSTSTPVTDDTGNGGDQATLSGTTVDADDPPGYDYSLAPPAPAEGSFDVGLGLALDMNGDRASAGTIALDLALELASTGFRNSEAFAALELQLALAFEGGRPSEGAFAAALGLALDFAGGRPSAAGTFDLGLDLALAFSGGERSRSDQSRILTAGNPGRIVGTTRNQPWEV